MNIQPGYSRIDTKDGRKFYGPTVASLGKTLHLKKAQQTATEALTYSKRFCEKFMRLKYGKEEKVSGDQG